MANSERRGSRSRALERSLSYSEAIGDDSRRSSIHIPTMNQTDVYTNEELKKHYRISQTYVEGKEISFPSGVPTTNVDTNPSSINSQQSYDKDDGLILSIDSDSPISGTRHFSDTSTQPVESSSVPIDMYDRIEVADSMYDERYDTSQTHGYSTPFSRRKKKGTTHRRQHGRPIRSRRVVYKNGDENVPIRSNIPAKSIKYMRDVVNTVINSKWRFIVMMMVLSHCIFWLFFASIWYWVAQAYAEDIGDGRQHCVNGTSSFAGMLMMSVETQMTIGYGIRFPNEECPEAIVVMVIEIVAGTALSGGLSSLLFTKLIRPNRHVSSVGFSKKATVCLRDGELVLQFRVWDLMNVHLIGSSITAYMLKPIRTLEGEMVQNYIHQLKLTQANALLIWPITVVHVIDAESPLFDLSAQDMMDYRFEIVVCLNGASKSMGTVTQSKTSYLSKEIIWGYRFQNVLRYSKRNEAYYIDIDNLNTVEQVETPLCSASRLKEFEEDIKSSRNILNTPDVSMTNLTISKENLDQLGVLTSCESLNRVETGTGSQKSYGWNFKRLYAEKYVAEQNQ